MVGKTAERHNCFATGRQTRSGGQAGHQERKTGPDCSGQSKTWQMGGTYGGKALGKAARKAPWFAHPPSSNSGLLPADCAKVCTFDELQRVSSTCVHMTGSSLIFTLISDRCSWAVCVPCALPYMPYLQPTDALTVSQSTDGPTWRVPGPAGGAA
jgi:hypothetical protein